MLTVLPVSPVLPQPLLHTLVVLPGTKPPTLLRLFLDLQIDDDDGDENDDIPKFISSFNTVNVQ